MGFSEENVRSAIIRMGVCGLLLAAAVVGASLAGAADKPALEYPPAISLEEVRKWVDKAPAGHPRLLASKAELAALGVHPPDDEPDY